MNSQMITLSGDGYKISPSPEAEKLKKSLLKEGSSIKAVEDKGDEGLALAVCSNLASFRKQLEATRKAVKQPAIDLGKKIDSIAEAFGRDVETEEKRVRSLLGGYQMKLAQEQQRILEEARRKQALADKALADAESARLAALKKQTVMAETKAEVLENKAVDARVAVMELEQKAADTRVAGGSMVWSFEIISLDELYNERPDLVKLEAKTREINEAMKRLEDQGKPVAIHGLRCFKIPRINIR